MLPPLLSTTTGLPTMSNAAEIIARAKLAKLNAEKNGTEAPKEESYQRYHSARMSTRVITDKGVRIKFTNFEFLTKDEAVIAFLDKEIAARGLPGITKGAVVTTTDLDPMATMERDLRAKIKAEMAEEAKKAALGITRDMGKTEKGLGINAASSKATAL